MPSVDSLCNDFHSALTRQCPRATDFPKNENLLMMLLDDKTLAQLVRRAELNDQTILILERQRFSQTVAELIKTKYHFDFVPDDRYIKGLFNCCVSIQRALDDLLDLPKFNEDLCSIFRKFLFFEFNVTRICKILSNAEFDFEDTFPLLVVALKMVKKNSESIFIRIQQESVVISRLLKDLDLGGYLLLDDKYTGPEVIHSLERNTIHLISAIERVTPNFTKQKLAICSVRYFVEAVYDFMVEIEVEFRANEVTRTERDLKNLKALITRDAKDPELLEAIVQAHTCSPHIIHEILADKQLQFCDEIKLKLSNNLRPQRHGPQQAHVRIAHIIMQVLQTNFEKQIKDQSHDFLKIALESFLTNRELAQDLTQHLKSMQNPSEELTQIFIRVKLYHQIIPILENMFLAEDLFSESKLDEIRLMLVRSNVTAKKKLTYLIQVAKQENSGIWGAVSSYVPTYWKTKPSTLALLSAIDMNQIPQLENLLNVLSQRAQYHKAQTYLKTHGILGQLDSVRIYLDKSEFEINKQSAELNEAKLNDKLKDLHHYLVELEHTKQQLEHSEYLCPGIATESIKKADLYQVKITELLYDAELKKLMFRFECFLKKHAELDQPDYQDDLVELRTAYCIYLPVIEKMAKVNQKKYEEVIQLLADQYTNLTDLEEQVSPNRLQNV